MTAAPCEASRQLARASHLLELMRGNGVYDIPQLQQTLNSHQCEHKDNEGTEE